MTHKQTIKAGTKPRLFYDRKVQKTGSTRLLSLGKVIPVGWRYVRIRKLREDINILYISIEKLYEEKNNAQTNTTHKNNKQNTQAIRTNDSNKPIVR